MTQPNAPSLADTAPRTALLAPRRLALLGVAAFLLAVMPDRAALAAAGGQLVIRVVDRDTGEPIACRMHLRDAAGKSRKAGRLPFWDDHFVFSGEVTLRLPVGNYTFDMERGLEYLDRSGHFRIDNFADDVKEVDMRRFVDMSAEGWWSGDLDVERPPHEIELLMQADDLHLAQVVTWSHDTNQWARRMLPETPLVQFDGNRYYHLMAGRHARAGTELLYLNLSKPIEPTGADAEFPTSLKYLRAAREQDGFWADVAKPFSWDLPMLVAHGQVDSVQIAHSHLCRKSVIDNEAGGKPREKLRYPPPSGNARWSQQIYFNLLECGLRIPPSAGSGSGRVPNPVGYNRAYVHVDGEVSYQRWWDGLRAGRVVVTNGPLLHPTVNGQLPGHVFRGTSGEPLELETGISLWTRQPISYLELIKNGQVEHSVRYDEYAKTGRLPTVRFDRSGWYLVRAVTDLPKTYRFAMTGPYYVEFDDQPRISKQAAQFFLDWVHERARQIKLHDPQQQREVIEDHRKGRDYWRDLVARANAE